MAWHPWENWRHWWSHQRAPILRQRSSFWTIQEWTWTGRTAWLASLFFTNWSPSQKLTWSCCFLLVKFLLPSPYRSAFLSEKDSLLRSELCYYTFFFKIDFCLSIKSTFKKAVKKLTPSFLALHQGVKISEMAFCFPTKNCISILNFFFSPQLFCGMQKRVFLCVKKLKTWLPFSKGSA